MPCEYCLDGIDQSKPILKKSLTAIPVDVEVTLEGDGSMKVFGFKDGRWSCTAHVDVNFCPMCGRSLGGE